jgi:hypothetical protein
MSEERGSLRFRFFDGEFAVCKLPDASGVDFSQECVFLSKTPDELSLVCPAESVPGNALKVEKGWALFRVEGTLDFALVGILAKISTALAASGISIFAVSTFDTDYILIKTPFLAAARHALETI